MPLRSSLELNAITESRLPYESVLPPPRTLLVNPADAYIFIKLVATVPLSLAAVEDAVAAVSLLETLDSRF